MAIAFLGRTLAFRTAINLPISSGFSRSFKFSSISLPKIVRKNCSSPALALRSLLALPDLGRIPAIGVRCFSTRPTTSSLNDPSPNWSNRPPKETILLDGCDFEHWLVVMEPPQGNPTRDEIIDSYIKTLAQVVGSEEEARMKIYSVSTKHYYAFGCLVSEELSYKIKPLPNVRWVLPDSYLDVKNKDYGGEPFIDGKAVPYDPKYHEEWVRNNARANERSRRNDRPRNFDRSRNFERRRENMQNRDFQNRDMPPMPNQDFQNRGVQNSMPGGDMPNRDLGPNRDHMNRDMPNPGSIPNRDYQSRDMPNPGSMPNRDYQSRDMPNPGSMPNRDYQSRDMPNPGSMPNRDYQSRDMPNPGSMPNRDYQSRDMPNPGSMPNRDYQSRDMPRMGGMPNREYPTMDRPNMGSTPNRDYPSRDMPNREMGGVAGGDHQNMPSSNYLGRDMPGINYQGGDIPSSNYQGRDVPPMPNREY